MEQARITQYIEASGRSEESLTLAMHGGNALIRLPAMLECQVARSSRQYLALK